MSIFSEGGQNRKCPAAQHKSGSNAHIIRYFWSRYSVMSVKRGVIVRSRTVELRLSRQLSEKVLIVLYVLLRYRGNECESDEITF